MKTSTKIVLGIIIVACAIPYLYMRTKVYECGRYQGKGFILGENGCECDKGLIPAPALEGPPRQLNDSQSVERWGCYTALELCRHFKGPTINRAEYSKENHELGCYIK